MLFGLIPAKNSVLVGAGSGALSIEPDVCATAMFAAFCPTAGVATDVPLPPHPLAATAPANPIATKATVLKA
jgi:hypothetical protein